MPKAKSTRTVEIVKVGIAEYLLQDLEVFLDVKFGETDKKELAQTSKLRAKAFKDFAIDIVEVYGVDPEKIEECGAELIAELTNSMHSTLSDILKDIRSSQAQPGKKRKIVDDETPVTKKGGKKK